jgi:hypothetical protein
MAFVSREGSAQMALVGEAAGKRDLCKVQTAFEQQSFRPFYSPFYQPSMRRSAGCQSEGTGKMAGGQAALPREIGNRWVAAEMGFDEFIGPTKLPGPKPASRRTRLARYAHWRRSAVGLAAVDPNDLAGDDDDPNTHEKTSFGKNVLSPGPGRLLPMGHAWPRRRRDDYDGPPRLKKTL